MGTHLQCSQYSRPYPSLGMLQTPPSEHRMASKDLLLVIPSTEVAPFVDSILRPGVENDFAEIVVGLDFAAFEAALAQHDRMVIACGMFVPNLKEIIAEIVGKSPRAKPVWIHSFSAGVDHLLTPEVKGSGAPVTNAKGCFSHSLAEYVLCGCMYFDKEITRLQANRTAAKWERFQVSPWQHRFARALFHSRAASVYPVRGVQTFVPHVHWESHGRGSLPLHKLVSDSAIPHCVSDLLPQSLCGVVGPQFSVADFVGHLSELFSSLYFSLVFAFILKVWLMPGGLFCSIGRRRQCPLSL